MIYERQVKAKIASVLNGEISIIDFARWIMSNSWNMHQDSSEEAIALVQSIHLLLAERDDSSIDDSNFLSELRSLAIVPVNDPRPIRLSAALSKNIHASMYVNGANKSQVEVFSFRNASSQNLQWLVPDLAQL